MQTLTYQNVLYYQPESVEEVKELIIRAKQDNKQIVVRGAGHSFPMSPTLEADSSYIHVLLTYLNKITHLNWETGKVTVQAGCHLGFDPYDPAGVSTEQNSLLYQLDPLNDKGQRTTPPGWTLPDLGGITHQTIGGFSATSSSGGSIKYAFEDAIVSVRIIYHSETGIEDQTFARPDNAETHPDDPFWGVAFAHLGLMGIVVEMTLQCEPAFNISGNETISATDACAVDLFGSGSNDKADLQSFLLKTDYTRLLFWPQPGVNKAVLWQAARQNAFDNWKSFVPKPYQEVPDINGSPTLAEDAADAIFTFIGRVPHGIEAIIQKWFGHTPSKRHAIEEMFANADDWLMKSILKVFAADGVQPFYDIGWKGIPMDNQMSDKLFEVWFTELWIPLDKTKEVMDSLQLFYQDPLNAGTFCCEIYAGKKSLFWMNPAYGTDVIRLDVYWFAKNTGDPADYFQRFWQHLMPFKFRPHWGKYLPAPDSEQGTSYLQQQYPKWKQFMQLRQQMDPHNLFLNSYWQEHLGIQQQVAPLTTLVESIT